MQSLVYTDQSADELRLNLVRGAVDKEKLTVLCTGVIDLPFKSGGQLEVGIIGASHYVELKNSVDNVLLTELFACVKCVELNPQERMLTAFLHEVGAVKKRVNGLEYEFESHKTMWKQSSQDFCTLSNAVASRLANHQLGLVYAFPKAKNDKFPPTTLVYAELLNQKAIGIKTIHAYPNEETLVFTSTTITEIEGDV